MITRWEIRENSVTAGSVYILCMVGTPEDMAHIQMELAFFCKPVGVKIRPFTNVFELHNISDDDALEKVRVKIETCVEDLTHGTKDGNFSDEGHGRKLNLDIISAETQVFPRSSDSEVVSAEDVFSSSPVHSLHIAEATRFAEITSKSSTKSKLSLATGGIDYDKEVDVFEGGIQLETQLDVGDGTFISLDTASGRKLQETTDFDPNAGLSGLLKASKLQSLNTQGGDTKSNVGEVSVVPGESQMSTGGNILNKIFRRFSGSKKDNETVSSKTVQAKTSAAQTKQEAKATTPENKIKKEEPKKEVQPKVAQTTAETKSKSAATQKIMHDAEEVFKEKQPQKQDSFAAPQNIPQPVAAPKPAEVKKEVKAVAKPPAATFAEQIFAPSSGDTLIAKMPVDDIFAAETVCDFYNNSEEFSTVQPAAQSVQNAADALRAVQSKAAPSMDSFMDVPNLLGAAPIAPKSSAPAPKAQSAAQQPAREEQEDSPLGDLLKQAPKKQEAPKQPAQKPVDAVKAASQQEEEIVLTRAAQQQTLSMPPTAASAQTAATNVQQTSSVPNHAAKNTFEQNLHQNIAFNEPTNVADIGGVTDVLKRTQAAQIAPKIMPAKPAFKVEPKAPVAPIKPAAAPQKPIISKAEEPAARKEVVAPMLAPKPAPAAPAPVAPKPIAQTTKAAPQPIKPVAAAPKMPSAPAKPIAPQAKPNVPPSAPKAPPAPLAKPATPPMPKPPAAPIAKAPVQQQKAEDKKPISNTPSAPIIPQGIKQEPKNMVQSKQAPLPPQQRAKMPLPPPPKPMAKEQAQEKPMADIKKNKWETEKNMTQEDINKIKNLAKPEPENEQEEAASAAPAAPAKPQGLPPVSKPVNLRPAVTPQNTAPQMPRQGQIIPPNATMRTPVPQMPRVAPIIPQGQRPIQGNVVRPQGAPINPAMQRPATQPPLARPAQQPIQRPAQQPQARVPQQAARPAQAQQPQPQAAEDAREKTKTIDHTIQIPIGQIYKKSSWPLEVPLVPTFTFENMDLASNRFPHAAAMSVMENVGTMYNPFVLYGEGGSGKTHFLNAMGYELSKKISQEKIFITNGVRLARGIQRSVEEGKIASLEETFKTAEVLIIDDIHLTAVNDQNREFISKLLNRFLKEKKQIIVSSKYPPESLERFEELVNFRLDQGWVSELKQPRPQHFGRIYTKMVQDSELNISEAQAQSFFGSSGYSLGEISRYIRSAKVLQRRIKDSNGPLRSDEDILSAMLAVSGEDQKSEVVKKAFEDIVSLQRGENTDWGSFGFFFPQDQSDKFKWIAYATMQRAKELGIKGGFNFALKSAYSTEHIISSAFKIANICDNKNLKGAIILGPSSISCTPAIRDNFYDILSHMLEIMMIRCGIINAESIKLPSSYVKVLGDVLK